MKVITSVVNNVHFIEIQYYTLKKYMTCDYEFIIFNDAKEFNDITNGGDITIKQQIKEKCDMLGIQCIHVENTHHLKTCDMSIRHTDTFNNYILPYQKQNPDKYLLLDSDMFLVDKFDENMIQQYSCGVVEQTRENGVYIWPGLCYMDFSQIVNQELLNWSCCPGMDSGGMMKEWLRLEIENDEDRIYFISSLSSCSWGQSSIPENIKNKEEIVSFLLEDPRNKDGNFFCELYDNRFLHYRAGSNWMGNGMKTHYSLSEKLKQILLNR
jgi:hypothetical protein